MTRVGGRAGALVRAGVEKDSAQVGIVAKGTVVELGATAEAADGTARVELVAPISGWVSAAQLVSSEAAEASPEPSPAEYEALFSAEGGAARDSFVGWDALRPSLEPVFGGGGRLRVLDAGCGTSGVVAALVALGHDARGVDVSAAAVASQRRRFPGPDGTARFAEADARGLDAAASELFGDGCGVDVVFDKGTSDALLGYRDSRAAVEAFLSAAAKALAAGGALVVVSNFRVGGAFADDAPEGVRRGFGAPGLAAIATRRGWTVRSSALVRGASRDCDVVVYAPPPAAPPPLPLPPPPPGGGPRFTEDELCPPWEDDDDDDDDDDGGGLPTWVEGDSLAPYLGTPADFLDAALRFAAVDPRDVVTDVGCGDGRLPTMAVAKFGASRGRGLELEADLVGRARTLAARRGVAHRVSFYECDVTAPLHPDVQRALDETTLLVMYLLPEALDRVRPLITRHLRATGDDRRVLCLGWAPKDLAPTRATALTFPNGAGMDIAILDAASLP